MRYPWLRRPVLPARVADPLIGVAVTLLYAVELWRWGADDLPRAFSAAALGGVGLALRRRSPLLGFVIAAASIELLNRVEPGFDNDSSALVLTFFIALYSLGRYAVGVERWLGAAAVVVFAVMFVLSDAGPGGADPGDVVFAAVFVGTPWGIGLVVQLRREREQTLTERHLELLHSQEERAREAVAAERARIARELHDVVSHAIAVTVLQARGGRKMLGVDQAAVRRSLDAIEHTNTQALSDMRRLLSLLRDADSGPVLGPQPSLQRLDALVEQVRSSGLAVEVDVRGTPNEVPLASTSRPTGSCRRR